MGFIQGMFMFSVLIYIVADLFTYYIF